MSKKPHLGRGLSALLGSEETTADLGPQRSLAIDLLHPGRYQPRGRFAPDELQALAQSVKENGILQPILVRPHERLAGHFEIVAGESARGIMALTMDGLAVGNGILTVENEAQAVVRADPEQLNKGAGAAEAAMALLALREKFA